MTPGTGKPLLPLNWSHDLLVLYCMVIVPVHVSKVRPTLSSPEFAAMEISRGVLTPTLGLVQGCYFPPCCATIPAPSTQTTAKKKKQFGRRWRPCHLRHPQGILVDECSRQQSRWAVAEKGTTLSSHLLIFGPSRDSHDLIAQIAHL